MTFSKLPMKMLVNSLQIPVILPQNAIFENYPGSKLPPLGVSIRRGGAAQIRSGAESSLARHEPSNSPTFQALRG